MDYSLEDPGAYSDCECDDPDPIDDEPWMPIECASCGGRL